jgi:hypothetical protein
MRMWIEDTNGRESEVELEPECTVEEVLEVAKEAVNTDREWVSVQFGNRIAVLNPAQVVRVVITGVPREPSETDGDGLKG